nr:uncharacterized protein LOC113810819 [Penaeus vannamei]
MGVQPWAVWRQSGHKGRHWLSTTVLVPPMEDMERYKIAFLVSHDNHTHQSQQLHLADLDFKVVLPEALNDVGSWLLRCEFEDSLCGWSQPTTEGDYSWVFARASPHARRTGPITGYPDGGHSGFLFADSLHGVEGSTADLFSPPLVLPGGPTRRSASGSPCSCSAPTWPRCRCTCCSASATAPTRPSCSTSWAARGSAGSRRA